MLIWEGSAGLENGSVHLCVLPWSPQELACLIASVCATSFGKELEQEGSVSRSSPVPRVHVNAAVLWAGSAQGHAAWRQGPLQAGLAEGKGIWLSPCRSCSTSWCTI